MSICQSSFTLAPLKTGDGHELQVKFLDGNKSLVSTKKFTFTPPKDVLKGEVVDVYSQNGITCDDILKHLFKKSDAQCVQKASGLLKDLKLNKPETLLVLDLKDGALGYGEGQEASVSKCEQTVCRFFKNGVDSSVSQHAKKFLKHFTPDFIFCEGSLKIDLLKSGNFDAAEIAYFNSKEGVMDFCQCAEFFINASKFGEEAQCAKTGSFLLDKYIAPVASKVAFQSCALSTVLYPAHYQHLYSPEKIDLLFGSSFSVKGQMDAKTKISLVTMEKKHEISLG